MVHVRSLGRRSCSLLRLSSSPLSHPGIVSDVLGRLTSGSGLAASGRGDACQRILGNRPRSGTWLFQLSLPGGDGSGGWCPVINLSHLNEFVQLTPFKMETVTSALLSVREGDFLASLDLKDAFQVPILISLRKLFGFPSEGTVYYFQALFFGPSTAPRVFTKVFAAMSASARSRGIQLLGYLDAWWVLASSERKPHTLSGPFSRFVVTLGMVINEKKSDLLPSWPAQYLGVTIGTEAVKVFPSLARVKKFLAVAEGGGGLLFCNFTSGSALAGGQDHLLGVARASGPSRTPSDALSAVASRGALILRDIPFLSSGAFTTGNGSGPVLVDAERPSVAGTSIRNTCSLSAPVFGCVLFKGGAVVHLLDHHVSRVWSAQGRLLHSNLLEMRALFLVLQAFREDVVTRHVPAMCDNSTVMACVNTPGGAVSRALCSLTSRLLKWTESLNIHLDARYLPGWSTVLADLLNRRGHVVGQSGLSTLGW